MTLYYETGNGLLPTRGMARCNLGLDVYLCCPGPSLSDINTDQLQTSGGIYTIAINTAWPTISKPDLWIGMDLPPCYPADLWHQPFPKIVRGPYGDQPVNGSTLRHQPNVMLADVDTAHISEIFNRRNHDARFVFNHSTFIFAIHLAVWMGAKRIHLLGCDMGGSKDYCHRQKLSHIQRERNSQLHAKLIGLMPELARLAKTNSIDIISTTPHSPINQHLPYVPLDDALKWSTSEPISPPTLYSTLAHYLQWSPIIEPAGVVTGADSNAEWMLPWWLKHLRKHNSLPIAFADFGMTDQARQWCQQHGRIVDLREPTREAGHPWHVKPLALLKSGFHKAIWMDCDIETRGNIEPMLDHADGNRIGVTRDPHTPFCKADSPVAAGIVATRHDNPLIVQWAHAAISGQYRGDQEALDSLRPAIDDQLSIMPAECQWLRMSGDKPGVLTMHWTGPAGKDEIRRQMASRT